MVAAIEVVVAHLRLVVAGPPAAATVPDLIAMPARACNISL